MELKNKNTILNTCEKLATAVNEAVIDKPTVLGDQLNCSRESLRSFT